MQISNLLFIISVCMLTAGCAHQMPKRPYVNIADISGCQIQGGNEKESTPEIIKVENSDLEKGAKDKEPRQAALHFIEFDDHGWTYPDKGFAGSFGERYGNASKQIDCAIADIRKKLSEGNGKVALYLYVHGWHHNSSHSDEDVRKFRNLIKQYARITRDRKVVGIYIGWDGETILQPGLNDILTFIPRKNAAHRVADGRIREVFGRIKALRQYYNRDGNGNDCAVVISPEEDRCRFRAVMIGHSFGGLILYSAVQPYLLETLATQIDEIGEGAVPATPRSQGIADLVVLLNPAFEASIYEALHRVAIQSRSEGSKPPLLVSLTSGGDWATRTMFPIARFINTLFHYPSTSKLEAEAIRDTIGNVAEYRTHVLCVSDGSCKDLDPNEEVFDESQTMPFCGMQLKKKADQRFKNTPVWNVLTYRDVMRGHSDITDARTINFFEHIYGLSINRTPPCKTPEDMKRATSPTKHNMPN